MDYGMRIWRFVIVVAAFLHRESGELALDLVGVEIYHPEA